MQSRRCKVARGMKFAGGGANVRRRFFKTPIVTFSI